MAQVGEMWRKPPKKLSLKPLKCAKGEENVERVKKFLLACPLTEGRLDAIKRHKNSIKKALKLNGIFDKALKEVDDLFDKKRWCWWY